MESSLNTGVQRETYWLTRFIMLRWMGFVYLIAFYVAAEQLVPLVGQDGLTPVKLFYKHLAEAGPANSWRFPSLFWIDSSDFSLRLISWLGVLGSLVVLSGYANSILMFLLWLFYISIVNVGQDWYGFGWEIQMCETGFLMIFLCPKLDPRPFAKEPPALPVIFLFRWLIVRIMLGSGLIKLRGDSCWHDLTALYYHFETQPIPNPFSSWFHFLPHWLLQAGVIWTFVVELGAPLFAFWPRWGRYMAGVLMVSFQFNLIISGNLSFFNWLTILPALACFDDRFWEMFSPGVLTKWIRLPDVTARPFLSTQITAWVLTAIIGLLSIAPIYNLIRPDQSMNTSYDPFNLVNSYGAFGSIGRERYVLIIEGTNEADPQTATDWKTYPYQASPWDPKLAPRLIAPYQPHLDWQLWFAAMGSYRDYPWSLNLIWKLLHNDPGTLSLFAGNPFPNQPPKWIRVILYRYHFALPGNPEHVYWTRQELGPWLPPLSKDSQDLINVVQAEGWDGGHD